MAHRKLNGEFLSASGPIQEYMELVVLHLTGSRDLERERQLPESFQLLLRFRAMYRTGRADRAIGPLKSLFAATDPFILGEAGFLFGNYLYSKHEYALAREHYERAVSQFSRIGLQARKLLTEFNLAQCLIFLGRRHEAYEIEDTVLIVSESLGLQNIQALALRSLAYRNLRRKALPRSLELFRKAESIFADLSNLSDASVCHLYSVLIQLANGEPISSFQLHGRYLKWPHARSEAFAAAITARIAGDPEGQKNALESCDQEIRESFDILGVNSARRTISSGRHRLSDQLITFLRSTSGATIEQCAEHLWPGETCLPSLEKRLWTLVYRVNQKQKIIFMSADKRYQVL